jgi:ribosomal-protein-alanine N-acetyltransferase
VSGPRGPELATERLALRRWRKDDREAFAALNADARVMEHFPGCLSSVQSRDRLRRIEEHFERHGFGLWALERRDVAGAIGFTGLSVTDFEADFTPCVEIGWRLAFEHWGRGYVSEAARAVVDFAFGELDLRELVSFTVPANVRSLAVMRRLGMRLDDPRGFEHPALPHGHPLRRHLLYRLVRPDPDSSH